MSSYRPGKRFGYSSRDSLSSYTPRGTSRYSSQGHRHYQDHYQSQDRYKRPLRKDKDASTPHQLWMGDLDPAWDELAISRIFSTLGTNPTSVKLIRDKADNRPLYSFVSFASAEECLAAYEKNGAPIPGVANRRLKVNRAAGGAGDELLLFVGDLAPEVTDAMLVAKFSQAYPSQIKLAKVMTNPQTRALKGFGFVKFASAESHLRALKEMNGQLIGGKPIRVGNVGGNDASTHPTKAAWAHVAVPQQQPPLNRNTDPNARTIRVVGAHRTVLENDIHSYFCAFGEVVVHSLRPGFLVHFDARQNAELAMLFLSGMPICDSRVSLEWAQENESVPAKPVLGVDEAFKQELAAHEAILSSW